MDSTNGGSPQGPEGPAGPGGAGGPDERGPQGGPGREPEREREREYSFQAHGGRYAVGLVLILLGVVFLAAQWIPGLHYWVSAERSWPLIIIGVAAMLALIGLVTGNTDMAVPTFIVGGIGGLLYWQNLTGNWGSWAWAWTFIPGFVGVGLLVAALLRGLQGRPMSSMLSGGIWNVFSSLVLFAIFGSFLGGPDWLTRYWPVGIVLLGVWVLVRPRRHREWRDDWRRDRDEWRQERRERREEWRDTRRRWRDGEDDKQG